MKEHGVLESRKWVGLLLFFFSFPGRQKIKRNKGKNSIYLSLVLFWLKQWLGPWPLSRPPNLAMNKIEEIKGTFPQVWQLRQMLRWKSYVVSAHTHRPPFPSIFQNAAARTHKPRSCLGRPHLHVSSSQRTWNLCPWRGQVGSSVSSLLIVKIHGWGALC